MLVDGKILASKPLCHASFWYQDKLYQLHGFHNKVLLDLGLGLAGPDIIFFDGSAEKKWNKRDKKSKKALREMTSTLKNKSNFFALKCMIRHYVCPHNKSQFC